MSANTERIGVVTDLMDAGVPSDSPTDPQADPAGDEQLSLRERKKLATRAALQRVALLMVDERGPDGVTVEDIAAGAEVSPRTFFNYFDSKEEAIVGFEADLIENMAAAVRARPASEPPMGALRAVMLRDAERIAASQELWELKMRVAVRYPSLFASTMTSSAKLEAALGEALAQREGSDPSTDPIPYLAAGIGSSAQRTAIGMWVRGRFRRSYPQVLTECFDALCSPRLRPVSE